MAADLGYPARSKNVTPEVAWREDNDVIWGTHVHVQARGPTRLENVETLVVSIVAAGCRVAPCRGVGGLSGRFRSGN
jgi:hypothetical protein